MSMAAALDQAPVSADFDGVICFGGVDWWYHNRGHYDLQMMREFSRRVPVLYINSIGMRAPRVGEGGMFVRRVLRKLGSFGRGLREVRPGFHVLSPVSPPGSASHAAFVRHLLAAQVRLAARRCGIHKPLVWVACPPAVAVLDSLPSAGLVYQRTDRFESFTGVDANAIAECDRQLKARADLVLYCSRVLYREEAASCRWALFADHGVDYERFAQAGRGIDQGAEPPADLRQIPGPRIGFVGGIDAHTFDPDLFLDIAGRLPHLHFVLVGGCSLPRGWCSLPNVHQMGQRPYESVADYMAACDVLIMPWNRSPWIQACNPVKLKEYLAVGRPVVSTPFPELDSYTGHVRTAENAADFAVAIEAALRDPPSPEDQRARVADQDWRARAELVWSAVLELSGAAARAGGAATAGRSQKAARALNHHHTGVPDDAAL